MDLIELYDFSEYQNIDVDSFEFDQIEALSIVDDYGHYHIAIDPFKLKSRADEKEKLGHELGHCMTGSFYNKNNIFDLKEKHEYRANKWMIKKLIPYDELIVACKKGYDNLYKLSQYFDMPQDAIEKAIEYYKEVENKNFN